MAESTSVRILERQWDVSSWHSAFEGCLAEEGSDCFCMTWPKDKSWEQGVELPRYYYDFSFKTVQSKEGCCQEVRLFPRSPTGVPWSRSGSGMADSNGQDSPVPMVCICWCFLVPGTMPRHCVFWLVSSHHSHGEGAVIFPGHIWGSRGSEACPVSCVVAELGPICKN